MISSLWGILLCLRVLRKKSLCWFLLMMRVVCKLQVRPSVIYTPRNLKLETLYLLSINTQTIVKMFFFYFS